MMLLQDALTRAQAQAGKRSGWGVLENGVFDGGGLSAVSGYRGTRVEDVDDCHTIFVFGGNG